MPIAIFNLIVL